MDYKNIFSSQTLEKLNKRSQENLKKLLGDKTLMQTMMSSTRLLQEIMAIEAPYKDQLEQLAIQMVEDMYPIINEDGINIDAKIVSMGDVNKSLDEIKINKPLVFSKNKNWTYVVPNKEKYAAILNQLKNQGWDLGNNKSTDFYKVSYPIFIKYKSDLKNTPNSSFHVTSMFDRNFEDILNIKDLPKDYLEESKINENSQEAKRRVINSLTQGAALHGTFSFYMFKEYLDAIDDTLVEKYNQLMKEVFGVYDDDNAIAMFLQMIAQGQKMGGGSSKVVINEIKINKPGRNKLKIETFPYSNGGSFKDDIQDVNNDVKNWAFTTKIFKNHIYIIPMYSEGFDVILKDLQNYLNSRGIKNHIIELNNYGPAIKILSQYYDVIKVLKENNKQGPTIQARAICFPMLVHEIIKGLYELVSLQGFSGTKDQNQAVVDKVDKLENEPLDLKYGKYIYDALNDIYAESGYDDSRIREFFFAEVYQLGDQEFVDFVENALNDELTPSQQSWIKQTLKEIQMDLRDDDFDQSGIE